MRESDKDRLCRQIVEEAGDAVIFADRDGGGRVLGPVAILRNVTARWVREKELRRRLAFLEAGQTTL